MLCKKELMGPRKEVPIFSREGVPPMALVVRIGGQENDKVLPLKKKMLV